jgi:hypothetical protein
VNGIATTTSQLISDFKVPLAFWAGTVIMFAVAGKVTGWFGLIGGKEKGEGSADPNIEYIVKDGKIAGAHYKQNK